MLWASEDQSIVGTTRLNRSRDDKDRIKAMMFLCVPLKNDQRFSTILKHQSKQI